MCVTLCVTLCIITCVIVAVCVTLCDTLYVITCVIVTVCYTLCHTVIPYHSVSHSLLQDSRDTSHHCFWLAVWVRMCLNLTSLPELMWSLNLHPHQLTYNRSTHVSHHSYIRNYGCYSNRWIPVIGQSWYQRRRRLNKMNWTLMKSWQPSHNCWHTWSVIKSTPLLRLS